MSTKDNEISINTSCTIYRSLLTSVRPLQFCVLFINILTNPKTVFVGWIKIFQLIDMDFNFRLNS